MDSRLVNEVRRADPDVTSEELADIVWLAAYMRGTRSPTSRSPSGRTGRPKATRDDSAPPVEDDPPAPAVRPGSAPGRTGTGAELASLRLPPRRLVSDAPGVSARSPAVAAIRSELEICRALNPLQRRVPSGSQTHPDEVASAEWIAETGLWVPTDRPVYERWLDVALVVDDSASMAIWQSTVGELRTLLERTGAFRDLRVWHLDGDLRRGPRLSISGEANADAGRDPTELVDPTGRRLVLVVSDCVGSAWATGAIGGALTAWASVGPTAIAQMLPQRLWADCPPEFLAVRLRGPAPGVPNSRLVVDIRHSNVDPRSAGLPIPVFELEGRWLKPWASLVSGTAGGWVNGTAIFTELLTNTEGPIPDPATAARPQDQLQRFRAQASPEAYKLATYLAAAPLSLDVMRLTQGAMCPTSKPSHLAEVFLSGLLRRVDAEDDATSHGSDDIEFDFQPGIRDELLQELPRQGALRVLARVSTFVSQRLGSPLDFRALLTTSELPESVPSLGEPFAQVAYQVLDSLGGRYAEAAGRLTRMAEIQRAVGAATSSSGPYAPSPVPSPVWKDRRATEEPGDTVSTGAPALAIERGPGQGMLPRIMRGVPSRNPRFTGRDDLLVKLRSLLVSSSERAALLPHALHGLGGVGKTQLAVEYVYRYAKEYDLICWLPAHDLTEVRAALVELGAAMGLPENPNVTRAVEAVLDELRTGQIYRHWLLIFDNANRPEELRPYLPYPSGHVLITSRDSKWSEMARAFEVDVFTRQESIALLQERVHGISKADADELADRLGDLPLALEQAGAWQAETGMPVEEYLNLFDDQYERLTEHPPSGYPAPMGATYRLALDGLREQSPAAAQLLDVCAFFGPEPIPVALLRDGRDADLPSPLDQALRDSIQLRRVLRELGRFALARVDALKDEISIHRLVQVVLRARLSDEQRTEMRRAAQRILAKANPGQPDVRTNWQRHRELSPHILPSALIDADEEPARKVVLDQIRYRWRRGDYESGRELGELTVRMWEARWGADDELTLIACRHLAMAMRTLGDYRQARELAERTLNRLRQRFGDDHEHTMVTADSVAWDLRISGKFREAKALDEDNLARHRREFGDDHPLTLKVANNFAVDLRWLGHFAEARKADEESVRRRRLVYGEEDQNTQLSVSSLARDLYGLGEYAEGLRLQENALAVQRRLLDANHGEVLLETRNLVILLRKVGHYARARDLAKDLVATYERRFGAVHEHTLAASLGYCNALRVTGQLDEAQQLGRDVLDRYQRAFGLEHPVTLACASNLAIVLRQLGSIDAALALNETTLAAFRRVLGTDHPFTLCCATNTSNDLASLHRHEPARELSEDTYRRSRAVRGDDHPYTLACALNTALDRRATGDEENVEPLLSQTLAGFRQRLGEDHPETLSATANRRADCDIEPPES